MSKLVKTQSTYHLVVNDKIIASMGDSDGKIQKLSLKNCQAIELGYDLDELAEEYSQGKSSSDVFKAAHKRDFIAGAKTILEILGDKKFSEIDVRKAIDIAWRNEDSNKIDIIQSIQQTEWEVSFNPDEKDSDGCLILKRL